MMSRNILLLYCTLYCTVQSDDDQKYPTLILSTVLYSLMMSRNILLLYWTLYCTVWWCPEISYSYTVHCTVQSDDQKYPTRMLYTVLYSLMMTRNILLLYCILYCTVQSVQYSLYSVLYKLSRNFPFKLTGSTSYKRNLWYNKKSWSPFLPVERYWPALLTQPVCCELQ